MNYIIGYSGTTPQIIPDAELTYWQQQGAVFLLAHPDDESIMYATIAQLQEQQIPLRFLYTTHYGDKGRLNGNSHASPEEVRHVREKECASAMVHLGAKEHVALPYPDMELSYQEKRDIEKKIMCQIRNWNPAALFSFHPQEITRYVDHPDHRKTGEIALDVSAGTNVCHLHPDTACNREAHRPHIFLWTTNQYFKPTHRVVLTAEVRAKRNEYLFTYHPSQFCKESVADWGPIFDGITAEGMNHQEQWVQVR